MKYLFTTLIILFLFQNSFSQNAEALEGWLNSVEKEFKEIDQTATTSTFRSGSPIYNRVRFNLLSDTYFIPVFGKPFDELGAFKIKSIGKKLQGLKQKKKFGSKYESKHPWMRRLDWYLWGVFKQSQPYQAASKEVQDLRRIKKEYTSTIQKLKGGQFDFSSLRSEKAEINVKYGKLLPKEIDAITSLINDRENYAATKEIAANIKTLNDFENDYPSLKKVERLKVESKAFYASIDAKAKQNFDTQIENKISQILSVSSVKETENLDSMDANELNQFNTSFNKKYQAYASKKEIRRVNERIYDAKKRRVISEFDNIVSKINTAESFGDLNVIRNTYLSLLYNLSDPKIASLSKKISIRTQEIENENELQKIAERELQETAVGEAMALNTDGLNFGEFFDYVFRGHFENIDIKRDDILLSGIFDHYIRTYGRQCSEHLPENKVRIMDLTCISETVTENGYGVEISRSCNEWKQIPSGYYAKPDLYNAKMKVENFHRKNALRTGIEMFTGKNSNGNAIDLYHKSKALKNDIPKMFKLNSCTSTSIRRFEENLRLFALNQPSIRMQGESKYAELKRSGGPTGQQDLVRLTDDLVTNQAETWAFNQYKINSIKNLHVRKDKQQRPAALSANYTYGSSLLGTRNGQVNITFENGLPKCIYFSDFPENCKTPNPGIVMNYAKGNYRLQ